jgi:hypothetical protein
MTSERHPFQGRETRMRRETSYGVAGSTDFVRLNGLSMTISPAVTTNEVTVPGVMVQTGVTVDDLFSTAKLDGVIDPNALTFIFAGLFGTPAFTSLGSGAYQWDWAWKGRKPNRPVSFEVYSGYAQRAERALGYISNTLSISGARPDGFKVSGDGFAKTSTRGQVMGGVAFERQTITKSGTVTGGTFTLTFNGETTAAIAYDAIASAIQTALEGVFGIEPGDVVVGGGPISTTPATIDFKGLYAGEDVALMTVDSSSLTGGGTYGIAQTTAGADDVVDIPQIVMGAITGDVWIDTTWAGLGTTQQLDCLGMGLDIAERMGRVTPINSSFSSDGVTDMGKQAHKLSLTMATNAALDAEIDKLVIGTPAFVRQKWTGPVISGGNHYALQIDTCVTYSDLGDSNNTQEVDTRDLSGMLTLDPTSQNVVAVRLVNGVSSLSPTN